MAKQQPSHIVIVPTPGIGHLIPLTQLARKLIHSHNFTISFIIPTSGPPSQAQRAALSALPESHSDYYFLPPATFDDLPPNTKIETRIALTLVQSILALRARLGDLARSRHLTVLVVDLFRTDAFSVGLEFGLNPYLFFPTTAMCLSFAFLLPELDAKVSGEFRDMHEPVRIPGCVPVHTKDLMDPVQDRKNDAYERMLHQAKGYRLAEGILVNTFEELEEGAVKTLQQPEPGKPPVYPVGPLIQNENGSDDDVDGSECLKWLDQQPRGSVLFVSFGSGGTLSHDQLTELGHGLEMCEQRFLWVVRSPNDRVVNATYFGPQGEKDLLDFLPIGFLERTKGRGLIIPSWAPQVKVLSHDSTGGFLTHCGWNSTLESVVHGVPLIAWPLFAEQRMNAVMLVEGLKVAALRPTVDENGLIAREAIAMVVKV